MLHGRFLILRTSVSTPLVVVLLLAVSLSPRAVEVQAQSLGGSASSLDRQNAEAQTHGFTYLENSSQVERFVTGGYLVDVSPNRDMELHQVSFPFARPEVRLFVRRLAAQYRNACGEKLVVTSLTRPQSSQPWNASDRSVHPTGMAVDFRRSNRRACRAWLESTLLALERRGVLEATRERRPPHYHVALYPRLYAAYVDRITSGGAGPTTDNRAPAETGVDVVAHGPASAGAQTSSVEVAQTGSAAVASPELAPTPPGPTAGAANTDAAESQRHRVASGESLWTIARRYGVDEVALRRANGLVGDGIHPGQTLTIPGDGAHGVDGAFEHTVARGESLWTIARAFRVEEDAIRAANRIRGSRIFPGQQLMIPIAAVQGATMRHTVANGESLWTIANRHGTTVEELRRRNGIRTNRIYAGQVLTVRRSF